MNLLSAALTIQRIEYLALSLPDMDKVVEALDAKEMEDEREGRSVPSFLLETWRPVFLAVGELQKVCRRRDEIVRARCAPPSEVKLG